MMFRNAFILSVLLCGCLLQGLAQTLPKTYALVIGISGYENKDLKSLAYADKDAGLFAAYLQSKAGGAVPDSQMRVLLNEKATIAAVYNAMDWLKQQTSENDIVYVYFSGHGDVETKSSKVNGYLLAYNTPAHNYPNNAISIEQLNNDANFLTLQKKAKVVLITDACHSGKLAGDFFKGKQLAATQLQQVLNNEVRLAACAVDELAAEADHWGGGRGVFSYYLLMGMYGFADGLKDGTIQLHELRRFIDSSFAADEFLKQQNHKQHPVTDGNPNTNMAVVHSETFAAFNASLPTVNKAPVMQPMDYFFTAVNDLPLESILQLKLYKKLTGDALALLIVNDCIAHLDSTTTSSFENIDSNQKVYDPAAYEQEIHEVNRVDSFKLFRTQLENKKIRINRFNDQFAAVVHNRAQEMVNAYLDGEESELEKRQYYYSGERQYSNFLAMLNIAMQLISTEHHLYNVLQINYHYLSGVIARLQMATSKKTDSLLKASFAFQRKTMELEPYAAYVHNEMANLFLHKRNFDSALYHFNLAIVLAPTWAIPWSNQVRMNLMLKDPKKAKLALNTADSLQPNLAYVLINAGLVAEQEQNWLAAESYYLHAIKQNNVHYLPFERLGHLNLKKGNYQLSNEYFYKASTRKNEFAINDAYFDFGIELGGNPFGKNELFLDTCFLNAISTGNKANPYIQLLAVLPFLNSKGVKQDSILQILTAITVKDPQIVLAHHYLAKQFFKMGRHTEAEQYLLTAIKNYLSETDFRQQIKTALYKPGETSADSCSYKSILFYNYNQTEDHYMLAAIYEKQKKYKEAAEQYQTISLYENKQQDEQAVYKNYDYYYMLFHNEITNPERRIDPYNAIMQMYEAPIIMGGSIKAARLFEQMGEYEMAEKTLLAQVIQNRGAGDNRGMHMKERKPGAYQLVADVNWYWLVINRNLESETYNFYRKMMKAFPRNYYWKEKAGLFLYNRLQLVYKQMPVEEYKWFTADMQKYAYPFMGGLEGPNREPVSIVLPGSEEVVVIAMPVYNPVQESLTFLNESIQLNGDVEPTEELQYTLATVNSWLGNYDEAAEWYQNILKKQPADSLLRNKLIEMLIMNNSLPAIQQQLDTLYFQRKINNGQVLLLAEYNLLSKQVQKNNLLLQLFKPTDREEKISLIKLNIIAAMQNNNFPEVLKLVKNINAIYNILDTSRNEETDDQMRLMAQFTFYTSARTYALMKQNAKAIQYLEKAMQWGLLYKNLLNNDPAWQGLRSSSTWKTLMKNYTAALEDHLTNNMNVPLGYRNPIIYRIPNEADYD
jgi:tetratricopeptide (TPR) repeat protein